METHRTYKIHFPQLGRWLRDETVEVADVVSAEELAAGVRAAVSRLLIVHNPQVTVDLEAGTVELDGGKTGTGTIVTSWPLPAGQCGMGMDRQPT